LSYQYRNTNFTESFDTDDQRESGRFSGKFRVRGLFQKIDFRVMNLLAKRFAISNQHVYSAFIQAIPLTVYKPHFNL
jgi:hypothetical protein